MEGAGLGAAAHQQYRCLTVLRVINTDSRAVYADVSEIMNRHWGRTISMGYGTRDSWFLSQHLLPLVFANHPYYFNFSAMMGFHDHFLSARGRNVIASRQVQVWLIPRGDAPFTIRSWYSPHPELFDPAFRAAFAQGYRRVGSSRFFDIYAVRAVEGRTR